MIDVQPACRCGSTSAEIPYPTEKVSATLPSGTVVDQFIHNIHCSSCGEVRVIKSPTDDQLNTCHQLPGSR